MTDHFKNQSLPNGWEESQFKDIAAYIQRGKSPKYAVHSNFPVINQKCIRWHGIDLEFLKYLDPNESHKWSQERYLQPGDILWNSTGTGTIGRASIYKGNIENAVADSHVTIIRLPTHQILPEYVFYFIMSPYVQKNIESMQSGSTDQVELGKTVIEETKIPLPPFAEQKRIVAKIEELFSEIDKGVENLLKTQDLLKAYRQSILKNAFEGKLTEKWREKNQGKLKTADEFRTYLRHKRKEHHQKSIEQWESNDATGSTAPSPRPRSLKNLNMLSATELENLPTLPDAWVWDKLGCMTLGVEYGTSAKSSKQGDVVVLRMGNIQNCTFIWKDLAFTSNKQEIAKYSLKKDDVLFNRTNSPELVGKTALYKGECPAIFAGYLIRINQIHSIETSKYLNFYLNSPVAKQHGNRVKTDGVNQSNINGDKLINYPFPFCSIEEQQVVVSMLEEYLFATDNLEREIQRDLHRLNALRQSVLKKAFSGELVPQDATDESASIVLGLIKSEKEILRPQKKKSKQLQKVAI